MPLRVRVWGTRGSIPTPGARTVRYGGNTPCIEVRTASGWLVILDAGTGIRELGQHLLDTAPETGIVTGDVFLTHAHWDHIQGIPFFRPAYDAKSELRIYGPKQSRSLKDLLGLGMDDPFFPVDLDGLPIKLSIIDVATGDERSVGPFTVRSVGIFHPAPALAYRIEAGGRTLVYATDTEDPFSGKPNPVIPLAKGAHTLIHDAQYLDNDFKKTWGHSTVDKAIEVAVEAGVSRLVLYHHDPDRSDDALDQIELEAQERAHKMRAGLEVVAASEGLELDI